MVRRPLRWCAFGRRYLDSLASRCALRHRWPFLHLTSDPDFGLVERLDKGHASVIGRPFSAKHLQADVTGAKMQRARSLRPAVEHISRGRLDVGNCLIATKACF